MDGSNDNQENHGSPETRDLQTQDGVDAGHSGHGAASALARFKSMKRERQQLDPEDAAGGHFQ